MKIYPAIFLLLFIPRKQYKAIAFGALVLASVTLGMFATVGPTISGALRDMAPAVTALRAEQMMVMARSNLRFDHSLFAIWKLIAAIYTSRVLGYSPESVGSLKFYTAGRIYSLITPLAFIAIYVLRIRKLPPLNQICLLILFSVLLPYVSYDYTLIHLYTMTALLLVVWLEGNLDEWQARVCSRIFILCAIIFTPLAALARHLYGGQIKCVLMLMSTYLIISVPFPTGLFSERRLQHRGTVPS